MIRNYLTLAFRNLFKRKLYSFINIFGLAIGVAVCLVILKYVDFELSYDSYHKDGDRTYRITTADYRNGAYVETAILSSYAYGPSIQADIPEVESYVRTHPMYGGAVVSFKRETGDPSTFHEESMQFADSTFFKLFTYTASQGDLSTALERPASVVITKKVVEKYFRPDEEPLGKILKISGGWADGEYEITAILDEVPQNTHYTFDFLFPTHNLLLGQQYQNDKGWGWNNFITYVQLAPNTDAKKVEAKYPEFIDKYKGEDLKRSNSREELILQPIRHIHTQPGLAYESSETTSVNIVYFFIVISVFILAIAWINYINLSTARAIERAREVGIKKALGAYRAQLITQFFFESILVNFLSVALAVVIAIGLLPILGEIVGKTFAFDFKDPRFWAILSGLFVLGSFVSGAYPAIVLSSFNIMEVIKGKSERVAGGFSMRKVLVVFQFASSLILIAGTFTIYRQVIYMRNQDKGLTMDQMLIVNGPSVVEGNPRQRLITLKNELKNIPGVAGVTTSGAIPGGGYNWGTGMRRDGAPREESKSGFVVWVDPDFVETYDISVIAGKDFDPTLTSSMRGILVNEAALTTFGLGTPDNAMKERLIVGGDTTEIIGVLKNFHWNSLKTEHVAFLFKADTISGRAYSIHLNGKNMTETIEAIGKKYSEAFPGNPYDYYFLDEFFNNQYRSEQQFSKIFSLFALLAIVIACLGLWGLASFTTAQRLKEIGIRKVLGASAGSITSLLSWQFLKLVLIASVLGLPLAWFGIDYWLSTFAFRIGIAWDLFVVPLIALVIIALATVSVQIMRGANTNPAKILRTE